MFMCLVGVFFKKKGSIIDHIRNKPQSTVISTFSNKQQQNSKNKSHEWIMSEALKHVNHTYITYFLWDKHTPAPIAEGSICFCQSQSFHGWNLSQILDRDLQRDHLLVAFDRFFGVLVREPHKHNNQDCSWKRKSNINAVQIPQKRCVKKCQ